MQTRIFAGREGQFLRRYDYGDSWTVAADLGVGDDAVDVDVVGSTAIVVVEDGDGVREGEIELPGPDATATVNNGVVLVRGEH